MAEAAYTPKADIVLMSACMPAPPTLSLPAIVRAHLYCIIVVSYVGAVARVCRKCALQLYATVVNLLIVQDRNISYGGIIRFRFYGYNLSSTIHAAPLISYLVRPQNYIKKPKRQRILYEKTGSSKIRGDATVLEGINRRRVWRPRHTLSQQMKQSKRIFDKT